MTRETVDLDTPATLATLTIDIARFLGGPRKSTTPRENVKKHFCIFPRNIRSHSAYLQRCSLKNGIIWPFNGDTFLGNCLETNERFYHNARNKRAFNAPTQGPLHPRHPSL